MEITSDRVRKNSSSDINRKIDRDISESIEFYRSQPPKQVQERIHELDKEWDIERTLEINAATIAFAGTALGILHNKKWLAVPLVVTTFLAQHALQGWCPPLPLFRRMGIRTRKEIDKEKYELEQLSKKEE